MCGIAGSFDHARSRGAVTEDLVVAMCDTIAHRGPDGSGAWVSDDARVGLGSRRLAIVDIEGGAQPMFGEHGEVVVFNGEIYNYPRLRERLEADGARFNTRCDTEVILHLYARHGDDCVRHLNGMFAFALWDPRRGELLFARDRIGEKPFYWADVGGSFVFGSEIKALLEHPAISPSLNASALEPYLTNLVTTGPETLYAGIHKLAPGQLGVCGPDGPRISRYWELFEPREWADVSLEDAAATLREMLDRSVHDRLLADVPVGVLLSGGIDSTTLVALLRDRAKGLATFSVGFDEHPHLDERDEARQVAEHYGTDHHDVSVSEMDAIRALPELIHHQDEPLADPVCLPLHFVCRLAREHDVPVVLAGEGSDELFWGYPVYANGLRRERWLQALLRLPRPARASLARLVPPDRYPRGRELLETIASGRIPPMHMPLGLTTAQRAHLLRRASGSPWQGWSPRDRDGLGPVDLANFDTQEYEFAVRLPELLLMRIDRFSMASSVEARVPFLDPELVEYAYRLPIDVKMRDGLGKLVLRQAVADIVPDWVMQRPKRGFGAPVKRWLQANLGTLFHSVLDDDLVREHFDREALGNALRGGEMGFELWPILNLVLWHKHWIEGESLEEIVAPVLGSAT